MITDNEPIITSENLSLEDHVQRLLHEFVNFTRVVLALQSFTKVCVVNCNVCGS